MRKGKIECKKSSRRQTLIIGVYLLLSRLPTSHTTVRAVRHTAVPILDSILYKRQIGRYNLACVAYHWIWLAVPCGQPRSNALYEVSVRWARCLPRLPSDSTSRWTPLPLTMQFPLLGLARDFHPLDNAHAERTNTRQALENQVLAFIYSFAIMF